MTVGDLGEFGVVARITSRLAASPDGLPGSAGVLLGPGDDGAVVAAPDGRVVATTDLLVDGRHFRRDFSSAYDVGRKAAAQNLADVVAMGARPTALLVGLAAPADLPVVWAERLADGLRDECALVGAAVVGGDVVESATLTVAVTALGDLAGRPPVTRAGARPGDAVVVVGRLGYAAAGLAMLTSGHAEHPLAAAHRRPQVPYAAARALADTGASAMLDVSDGLVGDLGHLARASRVRVELATDDLPLPPELVEAGLLVGVDPLRWVAGGGDDHAFVATLSDPDVLRLVVALAALPAPVPVTQLGRVVAVRGDAVGDVVFLDGSPVETGGHEHFRGP